MTIPWLVFLVMAAAVLIPWALLGIAACIVAGRDADAYDASLERLRDPGMGNPLSDRIDAWHRDPGGQSLTDFIDASGEIAPFRPAEGREHIAALQARNTRTDWDAELRALGDEER